MASTALDMSLDDLIKSNKKAKKGSGNPKRRNNNNNNNNKPSANLGPARRRFKTRGAAPKPAAAAAVKAPETTWQHDMFAEQQIGNRLQGGGARAVGSIETGTKLLISNLDFGVSSEDIKELFSEVGDLKRYTVHYDRSGRSKGTAEVVYSRRADAMVAFKKYNNVQLDGKPMKIEVIGTNVTTQAVPRPANGSFGNASGVRKGGQGRRGGGAASRARGGRRFGRGGRGPGKSRPEKISAEDLDADLDKYHSGAMETN